MKNCGSCGQTVEIGSYREAPAAPSVVSKPKREWKMAKKILDTVCELIIYTVVGLFFLGLIAGLLWVIGPGLYHLGHWAGADVLKIEILASEPQFCWVFGGAIIGTPIFAFFLGKTIMES